MLQEIARKYCLPACTGRNVIPVRFHRDKIYMQGRMWTIVCSSIRLRTGCATESKCPRWLTAESFEAVLTFHNFLSLQMRVFLWDQKYMLLLEDFLTGSIHLWRNDLNSLKTFGQYYFVISSLILFCFAWLGLIFDVNSCFGIREEFWVSTPEGFVYKSDVPSFTS